MRHDLGWDLDPAWTFLNHGSYGACPDELQAHLEADRIEIPVVSWPVRGARARPTDEPRRVLVRVSGQRYTEPSDIDALLASLARWRPGRSRD